MTAADRRDSAESRPTGLGTVGVAASLAGSWVSRLGVEGARRNAARAVAEDLARGRERAAADAAMRIARATVAERRGDAAGA